MFDEHTLIFVASKIEFSYKAKKSSCLSAEAPAFINVFNCIQLSTYPSGFWDCHLHAKIIKFRFSEDVIESLLRIKWWDWSLDKIHDNFKYFNDIERFVALHDK